MNPIDVVTAYTDAFDCKDMEKAKSVLDTDFHFDGPLMKAESRDEFFAQLANFDLEYQTKEHRVISQGTSVARIFDFAITSPVRATVPMVEWFEVENDKIQSSRLFYDTAIFPKP